MTLPVPQPPPDTQAARALIEEAQQWARAGQGRMVHALADELTRWVDASADTVGRGDQRAGWRPSEELIEDVLKCLQAGLIREIGYARNRLARVKYDEGGNSWSEPPQAARQGEGKP